MWTFIYDRYLHNLHTAVGSAIHEALIHPTVLLFMYWYPAETTAAAASSEDSKIMTAESLTNVAEVLLPLCKEPSVDKLFTMSPVEKVLEPQGDISLAAAEYSEQQRKKQQLLSNLKRHTKHLMEEAVTKKSVHEDSSSVTYFTAAIDECLSYGLKRRALGLFRSTTSTLALVQKLAKNNFEPARVVMNALHQFEREQQEQQSECGDSPSSSLSSSINVVMNWTSSLASMSSYRRPLSSEHAQNISPVSLTFGRASSVKVKKPVASYFSLMRGSTMHMSDPNSVNKLKKPPAVVKYMWIRLALFDKVLDKIVQHLVENASKYYAEHSLVGDLCEGSVFASLVAGPCSIEFVRCRVDIESGDLSADELVLRHRIHSPYMSYQVSNCSLPPTAATHNHARRQSINYTGIRTPKSQDSTSAGLPPISNSLTHFFSNGNANNSAENPNSADAGLREHLDLLMNGPPTNTVARLSAVAKGYVDSIHQNIRETLLYGKNNVKMELREGQPIPGYLSLHLINASERELILKWSPNRLMDNHDYNILPVVDVTEKSACWEMAQSINISDIFSIHCHQPRTLTHKTEEIPGNCTIVMVGADGVSISPIHFSPGGHLLNFLTCLAQGLNELGDALEPSLAAMQKEWDEEQQQTQQQENQAHKKTVKDSKFSDNNRPVANNDGEVRLTLGSDSTINGDVEAETEELTRQQPSSSNFLFCIVHNSQNLQSAHDLANQSTESVFGSMEENTIRSNGHGPAVSNSQSTERNRKTFPIPSKTASAMAASPLSRESMNATSPRSAGLATTLPRFAQTSTTSIDSTTSSCLTINSFSSGYMSSASNAGGNGTMCISPLAFVTQAKNLLDSGSRTMSLQTACEGMRRQILTRAFSGWLSHCRYIRTLRTKLAHIVHSGVVNEERPADAADGLTPERWLELSADKSDSNMLKLSYYVYYGGISDKQVRKQCWPYLLNHCAWNATDEKTAQNNEQIRAEYEDAMTHWMAADVVIQQRERELMNKYTSKMHQSAEKQQQKSEAAEAVAAQRADNVAAACSKKKQPNVKQTSFLGELADNIVDRISSITSSNTTSGGKKQVQSELKPSNQSETNGHVVGAAVSPVEQGDIKMSPLETRQIIKSLSEDKSSTLGNGTLHKPPFQRNQSVVVYDDEEYGPSAYSNSAQEVKQQQRASSSDEHDPSSRRESEGIVFFANGTNELLSQDAFGRSSEQLPTKIKKFLPPHLQALTTGRPSVDSVSSSIGLEHDLTHKTQEFADNVHRIDKDVARCDRAHPYFATSLSNLNKLRNIMCTYVWLNPQEGYVQGMCDLAAPLLVTFDDEPLTFSCFRQLMKRMSANFPGHADAGAMDRHFMNMRSLTQLLDAELFEVMRTNGDYTHFFFCYRWFLLDFKREFAYKDIFRVWECIWAADRLCSSEFPIFIALAMLQCYRDIIIENNMDFTEVIKFFNGLLFTRTYYKRTEMAERHDGETVLKVARDLVHRLQALVLVEAQQQKQQDASLSRKNFVNSSSSRGSSIDSVGVVAADVSLNCDSPNVAVNDNSLCGSEEAEDEKTVSHDIVANKGQVFATGE